MRDEEFPRSNRFRFKFLVFGRDTSVFGQGFEFVDQKKKPSLAGPPSFCHDSFRRESKDRTSRFFRLGVKLKSDAYTVIPRFRNCHWSPPLCPLVGFLLQEPYFEVPKGQAQVRGQPGKPGFHDLHHCPTNSLFQVRLGTAQSHPTGDSLCHVWGQKGHPMQPHCRGGSGTIPHGFGGRQVAIEQEH